MHRKNMKRKVIILSLLFTLSVMSIAYAAFQSNLKIKGTTRITSNWDIRITNVTSGVATGSAENASAPTWDKLTATMEANLYQKGDAMEYDVTITNNGTIDAVLSDIISTPSNDNAVIITYSGYTKGERLYKKGHEGNEKIVHVKIEYNPEYNGGETSGEANIDFNFTQRSSSPGGEVNSYLLTFNYSENGGTTSNVENEYIDEGTVINLEGKTATKQGYTFVGWNTDKDAQTGLSTATMTANTTLYAIFKKDITITYDKDSGVSEIGRQNDTCTIYNKATSCNKQLPSITLTNPNTSKALGWYDNDTKVGDAGDTYAATNSVTLIAKSKSNPIIMAWGQDASTDFHAEEYRTKITSVVFEDNKNVPEGATSWDVSAVSNSGNVIAWVTDDGNEGYVLHIGGEGGVIANIDSSFVFKDFTALTSITFGDNFDTSNAHFMMSMFENCSELTGLDLSGFNTSTVSYMESMFRNCSGLTSLDLSSFDTSAVVTMEKMFYGDSSLISVDVEDFDTSGVHTMFAMFYNCSSLTNISIGTGWSHSAAPSNSMTAMFCGCSGLTSLDLTNLDTSNVTSMENMFARCSGLTSLDLSSFNTEKVTNMVGMFNGCSSLTNLDLSSFDTSKVTSLSSMFYECRGLSKLSLCSFNTSNVTDMIYMFTNATSLKKVLVGPNWTTANATTISMFSGAGVSEVTQTNNCEAWSADTTAPTCNSSGGSNLWSTNQTITGTCSDEEGGSGCEKTTVSKNYTKSSTANGTTTGDYSPGEVCDNGGNCTTCPTQQVKVTGYTMSDYQTGAQVHYDGNASKPTSTAWADQSSTTKRNGTLVNATAGTNFVTFNGTSSYVRIARLNYTAVTMEVVFMPTEFKTSNSDIMSNIQSGGYSIYMNSSGGTTFRAYKSSAYQNPGSTTVALNEIHYAGGSANESMVKAYVDGTLKSKTVSGAIGTTGGSTYVVLGGNPSGNAANDQFFKGNIYAARIYNSVLSDDQLQKHYVIDKARFDF